ncbi:hypothetical protein [Streptomyces sp. MMG1121]|uniref:hypothetical protein n=1 Tax=Streptomyces sp. MMG1121 TaxID=1415544 RepID=UPI0006AEF960|nr:hypothetical protein [Streptomyces sp. MMG1121]KOV62025.1 hypothetical protein ADK64_26930 [Streptomyces sp. MMG1121]
MDPQLVALSSTAGSTLVTLMVTDGWQQARDKAVRLWQQFRPANAVAMADELDAARVAVVAARRSGIRIDEEALRVEWGRRVGELLASHQDAEPALRAVLADWEAASGAQAVGGNLHLEAHATDSSRVYQAGRDQHITER